MEECFISVDVETTGPVPAIYSMYQLGACVVGDEKSQFFGEIQLISEQVVPEALAACNVTLEQLRLRGDSPTTVMEKFSDWATKVAGKRKPILVAFAATFDWMFVEWYLQVFTGGSPFGHAGLDMKAYYMGLTGCRWDETKMSRIHPRYRSTRPHTHNALDDAIEQAEMFAKMLEHRAEIGGGG